MPLGITWSDRAFCIHYRLQNARSHGDDKWIGMLPEGVPADSPEGLAMVEQMKALYQAQRVMLRPFGSEVERSEATSQNWQIFKEIIESNNADAQRVLLGQDGTMSNSGGNYIKSWGLFGVRNDIVEASLAALSRGLTTGLLRPWSIKNFDRWDNLEYKWLIPDADDDARRESLAKRTDAFNKAVAETRANGFLMDQSAADKLAASFGVDAPTLAPPASNGQLAAVPEAQREGASRGVRSAA